MLCFYFGCWLPSPTNSAEESPRFSKWKCLCAIKHVSLPYVVDHFEALPWDSCATNESVLITVMRFAGAGSRFRFFWTSNFARQTRGGTHGKNRLFLQKTSFIRHFLQHVKKPALSCKVGSLKKRSVNIHSLSSADSEALNQWERREMKFSLDWITGSPNYKNIWNPSWTICIWLCWSHLLDHNTDESI